MLSKLIQQLQDQSTDTPEVSDAPSNQNVTLTFSISNTVTLEPEQYEGLTIQSLFEAYEDELGVDLNRVSSFKDLTTGYTVNASDVVEPGHSYKVLISATC
jgi:hypothetical protein